MNIKNFLIYCSKYAGPLYKPIMIWQCNLLEVEVRGLRFYVLYRDKLKVEPISVSPLG